MPAENFIQIYDFETAIPTGFRKLFLVDGINNVTTQDDAPKTQEIRPRIELFFSTVAETGHHAPTVPHFRADAFAGTLGITVISNTKPDEVGTKEHAEYVATVRDLMARARTLFKADRDANDSAGYLPFHAIHDVVATGSTPHYEGQDGYYQTDLNYDLKFSIRPDAWPSEE